MTAHMLATNKLFLNLALVHTHASAHITVCKGKVPTGCLSVEPVT